MAREKALSFSDLYYKYNYDKSETIFKPLWHYTSTDGLMGIINSSKENFGKMHFWFTRSDCLNDISEGNHILKLYKSICEKLYTDGTINECFYNGIKDAEISAHMFINFPLPSDAPDEINSAIDLQPCHAYICSFSLKEDSLDMWRYYSKGEGGYGLKLTPFLFDDYFEFETGDYSEDKEFSMIRSYKVIYDDSEKERMLREIITDTYTAYQNSGEDEEYRIKESKHRIQYVLKTLQYRFKNECYSSEQEYRFVFYRPYSKPDLLKNELPPVKYRKQNDIVVPYIDIVVDKGNKHLEEVLISPFIKNPIALDTTCEYLAECGFNTKTRISQLPVR